MKLFLTSEGKNPESIKKLENFLEDSLENKSIIYIPTASNGKGRGRWKKSETIEILKEMSGDIKIVELEDYFAGNVKDAIGTPDIIWFGGGLPGYLLYWIRVTKLDKYLPELFKRGTVYVGSSAGSMICAPTQFASEWYLGEPEPGASLIPGLNLIDFEIYPHFKDNLKPEIEKLWNKSKKSDNFKTGTNLYLLKDGDVITIVDGRVAILGEENTIS